MVCFQVLGSDYVVCGAAQAGQLELNVMMPVIAHNLNEMMQVMIGSIRAFTERLITGLVANADQASSWLARNPILVTALNPTIGYLKGAEVAKKCLREGKSVRQVVLELGYMGEDELDRALDAFQMTEGGIMK